AGSQGVPDTVARAKTCGVGAQSHSQGKLPGAEAGGLWHQCRYRRTSGKLGNSEGRTLNPVGILGFGRFLLRSPANRIRRKQIRRRTAACCRTDSTPATFLSAAYQRLQNRNSKLLSGTGT